MKFGWFAEATHDRPAARVARGTKNAAIRAVGDSMVLRDQGPAHPEHPEAGRRSGAR
jgi:hypothetical protein